MSISVDDVLVVAGVLLIGLSVGWLASWPGLLGYAGALCVIVGVGMARRR